MKDERSQKHRREKRSSKAAKRLAFALHISILIDANHKPAFTVSLAHYLFKNNIYWPEWQFLTWLATSYYIAPVGVRTDDLPHTVASNMDKVSYALTHSATLSHLGEVKVTADRHGRNGSTML